MGLPGDGGSMFKSVRFRLAGFDSGPEDKHKNDLLQKGAKFADSFSSENCTHLIVSSTAITIDDPWCVKAKEYGMVLVNEFWIADSIAKGAPADHQKVLYRPVKNLNGISGCLKFRFTSTDHPKSIREEQRLMCNLMGAAFYDWTPEYSMITHLVCSNSDDFEHEYAATRGIVVVSHDWLENCLDTWTIIATDKYAKRGFEIERMESQNIISGPSTSHQADRNSSTSISRTPSSIARRDTVAEPDKFSTPQHKRVSAISRSCNSDRARTVNISRRDTVAELDRFSTPQLKRVSAISRSSASDGAHSVNISRKRAKKVRKCRRMLEYSLSSESSEGSVSPPSRMGVISLQEYSNKYRDKFSVILRVPYQRATRLMAQRNAKIILRRSFIRLTKLHKLKKTLDGYFNSTNFLVDLLDNSVDLRGVKELPYSHSGFRRDRTQYVKMVKEEIFGGTDIPADVLYWLTLILDEKNGWDPDLLGNHIYMLESRESYGLFMTFCSIIHGLRKDKPERYAKLRDSQIFAQYINWDIHFNFSYLEDTRTRRTWNPDTREYEEAVFERNIMGLVWLFRCCWQHPAQKFPHLLIPVILGEDIPSMLSDLQKALFDAKLL